MFYIKKLTQIIVVIASTMALSSCGGGSIGDFDEFQPRPATVGDFSDKTFDFTWLPDGNPLNPDLGKMTIVFGALDGGGHGSFSVQEHGAGSASGTVDFASPTLTFHVSSKVGDIPLNTGDNIPLVIEADVSDGRIRLTNNATSAEVTSDPGP